jgi:hypothetical protein
LVLKDIRELWDVDLEGKPLGAVRLCRAEFRKAFNMKQEVLASYDHDEVRAFVWPAERSDRGFSVL